MHLAWSCFSAPAPTPSLPLQHYSLIEDKELAPLEELISQFQGKMAAKSNLQQLI